MFLSVKGRKIGGSSCPNGSKVSYRCGRCRKAFDDAKSIILHAQQAHRISQMPYPCPDCGVAGYNCNKLLKKHLRNKCLGRGWETRLEANGNIRIRENSPQDTYSRRTSSHLEKPASKLSSNCDLLVSGKVRRKAPKSAPIPGGRVHHKNRLRRSSLRSAQSEMLTNDRSGIPEDFPSKPFSKEETFANPPSEVSSSHESLPISVRMSTRMRTMSSSEQKRTKEAGNCNPVPHGQLGTVVPKGEGKYSPKVGRKDASSNFAVSSRNRLVSSPTESKKKSPLQKISKVDSPRNLKKSRSIAAKSVESTVCASENSGVSGKLTTGSGSSNATNPQSTGRLHASPTKSARSNTDASKKSHRSHGSSISRGSLDVSSDSKESHSSAYVPNESAAGKKKGSAKLKVSGPVVHRKMSQNRVCKQVVSGDLSVDKKSLFVSTSLHTNCTESFNELTGIVSQSCVGNQSTDPSDPLHKKVSPSNAPSALKLLGKLPKRLLRKPIGELGGVDCKELNKVMELGDNSTALRNQTSLKGLTGADGTKELGASSLSQATVMLTYLKRKGNSKTPSRPFLPTLLDAPVKLEMITDKPKVNFNFLKKSAGAVVKTIKLKSDDLKRGDELATEAKYPTSERAPDDDVEMPTVVRNRCDVAQAIKPESSEAFMDKSSGFGPLREASEVDEVSRVSKRSIPVKPTSSTASDSCVKSTQCMAVSTAGKPNDGSQIAPKRSPSKFSITGLEDSPTMNFTSTTAVATSTSIAAPAGTMSSTPATSSLTGKVALVDWDCFIAKDPRKARCNSATVTSAPITSNHHYTKSSQKSQPLSNVKLAVVAYRGPDTSTSQFAEQRSPSHPKEAPVAEVSTSPPSKKRVADTASSSECRSRQARSSNSSTSVSVRASIEGSNVENPTLVTPSMCNNEELSSRRVSASSLDSSLPMNDNGRVFELKISDINTLGSPSIMSSACGKESENVTQNVVRPLSSHDNSDSNSEATAPAVSNGQDLLISVSDCQVGDNQALRKRLRPRKSIDYGLARRSSKRLKVEEVENEVVSKNVNAKHKESWKDEDDEEEMGQGNSESKGKHMSTHSCPVCRLTGFATLAELKVHRTISCRRKLKKPKHLKERSIAWYCPGCPTTQGPFESAADLLTHLLTCRTKKFCGGRVKVNHPALSTGPLCPSTLLGPSTTFGCSVCGVIVASESRLDKHRRDEHNY